ncbi:MAG: type IVB secretion system protein IcmH/DotU [Vicinamibacterales bacterium]
MSDSDDPLKASDSTIIRPRPGAGRRGASDTILPRPHAPTPASADVPIAQLRPLVGGLNPLVQAASPALLLAGRIRSTAAAFDIASLKRHALEEIRRFEESARGAGVSGETLGAARYALCSTIDEAVLSTPTGAHSDWGQQSLLVALHREAWGGEKVFEVIERISQDPARHIDLIELHYLCLAVGFTGRYHVLERGHARLAEVQQTLYRIIQTQRGAAPPELSLQWRGREDRRPRLVRYLPWWVVGAGALAAMSLAFVVFYARLGIAATPVYEALADAGRSISRQPPPPPVAGPRLKQLLAPEEGRGELSVIEEGGRSRVILFSPSLFASGSATPIAGATPLIQRVGWAIEQVPGRVLVEGHTDDQPLNSLTYKNNFELSRERAANVVQLLQRTVTNPARLEWAGVGSSEPRYLPETAPENRARNRRVEIIHVPGA